MIDLNPLVIDRHELPCPPPNASAEEAQAIWYQITDKISYLPGVTSSVSYNACMHDLADGLQTHTFAPAGVEIRGRWIIGGTMPGEKPNNVELGKAAPRQGLYLEETTELKCNFLMTGFIKKNLKASHSKVVEKIVEIARHAEAKPPVPQKDPGYHSRGPSLAAGGEDITAQRPLSSGGQAGTLDSRKKYTPEYDRYRLSQDAQSFGRENQVVRDSGGYREPVVASPPSAQLQQQPVELPAQLLPQTYRPISELP
jgi:hypothetical protein